MLLYILFFAVVTVNVEYTDGTIGVLKCDTTELIRYHPDAMFISVDDCQNVRNGDTIFSDSFE